MKTQSGSFLIYKAIGSSLNILGRSYLYSGARCGAGAKAAGLRQTAQESDYGTENCPESRTPRLTPEQFAHLGDGAIAYVRSMRSEDVTRLYPEAPEIGPGLTVFALLSADGSPIVLADTKEGALANAWENKLMTVSLH